MESGGSAVMNRCTKLDLTPMALKEAPNSFKLCLRDDAAGWLKVAVALLIAWAGCGAPVAHAASPSLAKSCETAYQKAVQDAGKVYQNTAEGIQKQMENDPSIVEL